MTTKEAAAILRKYNEWRTGNGRYDFTPRELTEALNVVIQDTKHHVPDAGKVIDILDQVDAGREDEASNFVRNFDQKGVDHWSFKQGAKWAIEQIRAELLKDKP